MAGVIVGLGAASASSALSAGELPPAGGGLEGDGGGSPGLFPPIMFFYSHLHNSIRSELTALGSTALALDPSAPEAELTRRLTVLQERYRFLENVYKYHSNVEDEVRFLPVDASVAHAAHGWDAPTA